MRLREVYLVEQLKKDAKMDAYMEIASHICEELQQDNEITEQAWAKLTQSIQMFIHRKELEYEDYIP